MASSVNVIRISSFTKLHELTHSHSHHNAAEDEATARGSYACDHRSSIASIYLETCRDSAHHECSQLVQTSQTALEAA